jgi:hypothetical protein
MAEDLNQAIRIELLFGLGVFLFAVCITSNTRFVRNKDAPLTAFFNFVPFSGWIILPDLSPLVGPDVRRASRRIYRRVRRN